MQRDSHRESQCRAGRWLDLPGWRITKLLDMIVCDGRSLYTASMINSRAIALFVSGAAFALVVVLSCNSRSPITTIDANVADASSLDVAVPESCCSNITVTGITKTISAENDAAQLRSAVVPVSVGESGPLLSGPIVITTLVQQFSGIPGSGIVTTQLYFSTTGLCNGPSGALIFLALPASTGANGFSGRLWIPAGTTLCRFESSSTGGVDNGTLMYTGFVPY